jgi:hypothetical protein
LKFKGIYLLSKIFAGYSFPTRQRPLHPHSAAHTKETLQELKLESLDNPTCSPDLAPSDFHLFGPLKVALRGRQFADDDVKEAVLDWLSIKRKWYKKIRGPFY